MIISIGILVHLIPILPSGNFLIIGFHHLFILRLVYCYIHIKKYYQSDKNFSILLINNFLIFIKLKKLSKIINIFDKPDKHLKKHKSNVPLLGGIIVIQIFLFYHFQ